MVEHERVKISSVGKTSYPSTLIYLVTSDLDDYISSYFKIFPLCIEIKIPSLLNCQHSLENSLQVLAAKLTALFSVLNVQNEYCWIFKFTCSISLPLKIWCRLFLRPYF